MSTLKAGDWIKIGDEIMLVKRAVKPPSMKDNAGDGQYGAAYPKRRKPKRKGKK